MRMLPFFSWLVDVVFIAAALISVAFIAGYFLG